MYRRSWAPRDRSRPILHLPTLLRVGRYVWPYSRQWGLLLAAILSSAAFGLVPPLLIRQAIDEAIPRGDGRQLTLLVAGMVGLPLISGLVGVGQTYLNAFIGQRVMFDLRDQLHRRLQAMSLRFFTQARTGEIMSRIDNDVGAVQGVITRTFNAVITNTITLVSTVAMMLYLEWRLTLLALAILPWFFLPAWRVGLANRRLVREAHQKLAEMSAALQETFSVSGALLVKTFAREEYERERFLRMNTELMDLRVRQAMAGRWFFMAMGLFSALAPALVYWYGGHRVIAQELTIGSVVAFAAYIGRLFTPVSQLLRVHVEIQGATSLFERIFEYLDLPAEIEEKPGAPPLRVGRGRISFSHVSFAYVPGRQVLRDVTLEIEPGQMAALVGPSGAGKTTLAYLVARLYDVDEGRVSIDGQDVRDVALASLRREVGLVTQETFLIHSNVRDNLRYARQDASDEEIEEAARAAQIHETILALPQGYDTIVGERGYRLSGGEKQRLAIARALLKAPKVVILDEATSSLDSHAERLVQEALARLLAGRTSIVIAHRLSTIVHADAIFVLHEGRLVEQGRHEELLARGGLYAALYHEQWKDGQLDYWPGGVAALAADG